MNRLRVVLAPKHKPGKYAEYFELDSIEVRLNLFFDL